MGLLHRIKDPVEGMAYVTGCTACDPDDMRAPCRMELTVQAPGVDAFAIEKTFEVWAGQWPSPGDTLPVVFDRGHHDRMKIDWGRVPSWDQTAREQAQQMAESINTGGPAPPPGAAQAPQIQVLGADSPEAQQALGMLSQMLGGAAGPPAAAGGEPDLLEQLDKLGKLHESGVLTDDEFAAQKAKLLAGGA